MPIDRLGAHKKTIISVSVFLFFLAVFYYLFAVRPYEKTDDAFLHADMAVISAKIPGYVNQVHIQDNQKVAANALLVTIDDTDYKARLDEATAAVHTAEAALQGVQNKITLQERRITQASALLDAANASLIFATKEFDRSQSLKEKSVISQKRLDRDQTDLAKAKAEQKGALAAQNAAQEEMATFLAQQQEARSRLEQARALQKVALDAWENTKIVAGFAGVIGNRAVQKGQFVRPGQNLMVLVDTRNPYIIANFKETQMMHMKPGQPVSVDVDAYPQLKLTGLVDSIAPATGALFSLLPPENATGNFTKVVQRIPVKIKLDHCKEHCDLLRAGLSAIVSVKTR